MLKYILKMIAVDLLGSALLMTFLLFLIASIQFLIEYFSVFVCFFFHISDPLYCDLIYFFLMWYIWSYITICFHYICSDEFSN